MDELVQPFKFSPSTLLWDSPSHQRDLQSCSIVCSALLPYARARILPYLRLLQPEAFCNSLGFMHVLPYLRTQPRVLCLKDMREETEDWMLPRAKQWDGLVPHILHMLQGLTSIKELYIQETQYAVDQPTLLLSATGGLAVPTLSNISHLTLCSCRFDCGSTLLSLVLQFPRLVILEVVNCRIVSQAGPARLNSVVQLALNRLQVVLGEPEDDGLLPSEACVSMLSKHLLPSSIRVLECDMPSTAKGRTTLRDVVQQFGASLQSMHVHWCFILINGDAAYADLIATLSSHAPNVRSMTQTLPWTEAVSIDNILYVLEQLHTGTSAPENLSLLLAGITQDWLVAYADIECIAKLVRGQLHIALDDCWTLADLAPDERWQQRERGTANILRHADGQSFMVARDVFEFEGEGDGCVVVHLECTEMDGVMNKFCALRFQRCEPLAPL